MYLQYKMQLLQLTSMIMLHIDVWLTLRLNKSSLTTIKVLQFTNESKAKYDSECKKTGCLISERTMLHKDLQKVISLHV